jgi:hypothetical protein
MIKKILINLLVAGVALSVSLMLGEFIARGYLHYQDRVIQAKNRENILTQVPKKELYAPASPGNFTNRPNASVNWWGHHIQTDSLGCRTGISAPDSAKTILFIGDSMIFGLGLPDSLTIPSLLQQELNRRSPRSPVRVINAGVIGYDFQRYIYHLQRLGPMLKPGLVIIGLCYNDLLPNEDPFGDIMASLAAPEKRPAEQMMLAPRKQPRPSELGIIKGAIRSSALYTLWSQAGSGSRSRKQDFATSDPLKMASLEQAPVLIEDLLGIAEQMNVKLTFVYFPVHQSLGQDSDLMYVRLLQERGLAVLDLSHSEDLARESYFFRENRGHLLPDIHFNVPGSRVVAGEIATWLIKEKLWREN